MNDFAKKIVKADYKKKARRLLIACVLYVVAGIILGVVLMNGPLGRALTDREPEALPPNGERGYYDRGHWDDWDDIFDLDDRLEHALERAWRGDGLSPWIGIAMAVYGIIGLLLLAYYWLLVAAWTYKEASKSKMDAGLWGLVALVFNLPAMIVFLAVRSAMRAECTKCGEWGMPARFCGGCGAPMQKVCPSCKKAVNLKAKFCDSCGVKLAAEELEIATSADDEEQNN